MKARVLTVVGGVGLLLATAPASAHHAFTAVFDASKPVKLTGAVTKVDWRNPHAWFYIDVTDETGKVTNWALEMGGSTVLFRNGWRPSTLKPGDVVTVEGNAARDGGSRANARVVLMSTGQRLFAGSSQDTQPGQESQENRP